MTDTAFLVRGRGRFSEGVGEQARIASAVAASSAVDDPGACCGSNGSAIKVATDGLLT